MKSLWLVARLTEPRRTLSILRNRRRSRTTWSTQWTRKSSVSMNRRLSTKPNSSLRKKRQQLPVTPWKRPPLKLRRSWWARRPFWRTGRSPSSACSNVTRPFKPSRSWLSRRTTRSFKSRARLQVSVMRPAANRSSRRSCTRNFKSARVNRTSSNSVVTRLKLIRSAYRSSTWCSRRLSNPLRRSLNAWMLKSQMLMKRCKFLRSQLCSCTLKPREFVMTL